MVDRDITPPQFPSHYQTEYEQITTLVDGVYNSAVAGQYGLFESGVVKQMYAPNEKFLPGGDFFDRLGSVVDNKHMPAEIDIFDLGIDVGASIVSNSKSTRSLVLGYLNVCVNMDAARVAFVGVRPISRTTNALHTYIRKQVLDALPHDAKTKNLINVIHDALNGAYQHEAPDRAQTFVWMNAKLNMLESEYYQAANFDERVADYYERAGRLSTEEIEKVDFDARLLNNRSMVQRKYGTKPAYTEASIGGSWIFHDGDDFRRTILRSTNNVMLPPFAAIVHHSPLEDLKDLSFKLEDEDSYDGRIKYVGGGLKDAKTDLRIVIGLDGSMTVDYEGLIPVEDVARNSPIAARMLKAEIASNFYDLSMPIDEASPDNTRNYSGMSEAERRNFNPVLQLLVPRIRRINDAEAVSIEHPRVVREHDVVWFVRKLRPGWHASPEAIENASRIGIELGANETFVRAHKRGAGHSVLGYHAVKRSMELEAGSDY